MRRKKELPDRLEEAAGQHRLVKGIREVRQATCERKGKVLILEKNYRFASQHGSEPGITEAANEPYDHLSCTRDAVDDVMEKGAKKWRRCGIHRRRCT
jgi:hypothetical protein